MRIIKPKTHYVYKAVTLVRFWAFSFQNIYSNLLLIKKKDLPVEEACMFKQIFDNYDKNHDGLLSKLEFQDFFKKSGRYYTDKQVNFFVSKIF